MKKQSKKVGVAGSFQNQMMGNNASEPKVGEGATILMYSDREPYEVIEVAEDGMSCVIRNMSAKHIGQCYGDERYELSSNPKGYTQTLEWNEKKGCWGSVSYSVDIIKSLYNKYCKEYGYTDAMEILLKDFGIANYQDLYEDPKADNFYNQKMLIKGVTKRYKNFSKVSVIFGSADKYRDPSF